MTSIQGRVVTGLVMLAGLTATLAQPVAADEPSQSVLRAQSHAVTAAIDAQVRSRRNPALRPAGSDQAGNPALPGPQRMPAPQGAQLHADPVPGSPALNHLGVGAPMIVTRPADPSGWTEVVSGGQHGYVWSPSLTPQGSPPAPWGAGR